MDSYDKIIPYWLCDWCSVLHNDQDPPDSFGIPDDQRMAVVAKTPEEIRKLSRIAIAFAMENGSDPRKTRTIGLIIEELSSLFLEYETEDSKSHNINLTTVAKGDDFIIRMYNDYARFNIKLFHHPKQSLITC